MAREMFGEVSNPSIRVGSQKWYTVPVSILLHVVLIGAVVIIPLMAADVLPTPPSMMALVAAPPPPPPPQEITWKLKYNSIRKKRTFFIFFP